MIDGRMSHDSFLIDGMGSFGNYDNNYEDSRLIS